MKMLKKTTGIGQINCWTLGDFRVSELIKNGRIYKSQNVKREGIHIRTSLPHSNLLIWRLIGSGNVFRSKGGNLWPTYRVSVQSILLSPSFGLVWAMNTTSLWHRPSEELPDTWRSISLRTLYFLQHGLVAGDVSVTRNPFPNYQTERLMHSYLSNVRIGNDLVERQLWLQHMIDIAQTKPYSG